MHGLKHIVLDGNGKKRPLGEVFSYKTYKEAFLWLILCSLSIGMFLYMSTLTWSRFKGTPTVVTVNILEMNIIYIWLHILKTDPSLGFRKLHLVWFFIIHSCLNKKNYWLRSVFTNIIAIRNMSKDSNISYIMYNNIYV